MDSSRQIVFFLMAIDNFLNYFNYFYKGVPSLLAIIHSQKKKIVKKLKPFFVRNGVVWSIAYGGLKYHMPPSANWWPQGFPKSFRTTPKFLEKIKPKLENLIK